MLQNRTIGFIGAGNMAEALIKGLLKSRKTTPGQLCASDALSARTVHVASIYGIKVFTKNFETAKASDIIFLSIKPKDFGDALKDIAPELTKEKILVSVAAGKTTSGIRETLHAAGMKHHLSIVRAMPNTPSLIGLGAIGLFASGSTSSNELSTVKEILSSVGNVITVGDESMMDAITGLSGSGPAYVYLFIESMIEAGVKAGLERKVSEELSLKTVYGAAKLAIDSGQNMDSLIKMVASPGGTTVEGLKALDDAGFKNIISEAVLAATRRSKELSGQ